MFWTSNGFQALTLFNKVINLTLFNKQRKVRNMRQTVCHTCQDLFNPVSLIMYLKCFLLTSPGNSLYIVQLII